MPDIIAPIIIHTEEMFVNIEIINTKPKIIPPPMSLTPDFQNFITAFKISTLTATRIPLNAYLTSFIFSNCFKKLAIIVLNSVYVKYVQDM